MKYTPKNLKKILKIANFNYKLIITIVFENFIELYKIYIFVICKVMSGMVSNIQELT